MQIFPDLLWLKSLKSIIDVAPLIVEPETLLSETISLMAEHGATNIIVGNGEVLGWLSERDVVKLIALGVEGKTTKIAEVMNTSVIVFHLADFVDMNAMISILSQYQSSCLLVIKEKEELMGTVTSETVCQRWQLLTQRTLALVETNKQLIGEISDRQIAQNSLFHFHKAIESISDAIVFSDLTDVSTYINPAFQELYGYNLEELQVSGGLEQIFADPGEHEQILATVMNEDSWRGEVTMRSHHGLMLRIYLRSDAIKDSHGNIIGTVSIHTDITQHKQAEEKLRLRDRAIDASINGIIIADASISNGPIIYVNPAFERMTGYSADEVIGQNFRLLQSADIDQPGFIELTTAIEEKRACSVVLRNYRKNGSLLWNELNVSPVYDSSGELTHYIGIQTDITKRKQAETALLIHQQRLQYLLTASPAVIYTCKTSGNYESTFVGDNMTEVTGYTAQAFIENPSFWSSRIHPEDVSSVFAKLEHILERGNYNLEYRFLHQDGTYRWLYDQGRLVQDNTSNQVELVGYIIDITERKQLEENLKLALEKEKELSELKSRFVSMTSHEFRTPLSTILSSAELLEHYRHKWTPEKELTHLHRIQTAVKQMTEMLNDILIIGKAEVGKLELIVESCDIVAYCRQLVAEIQGKFSDNQIYFTSAYESMVGYIDPKLLGHILNNLLVNAIKYSPVNSYVQFTFNCEHGWVIFTIQDWGIGVPPDDIPYLFESFHRARNVEHIVGTGLGLAIVKKCVDIHQGQIFVDSTLGVSTIFTVKLPLNHLNIN